MTNREADALSQNLMKPDILHAQRVSAPFHWSAPALKRGGRPHLVVARALDRDISLHCSVNREKPTLHLPRESNRAEPIG